MAAGCKLNRTRESKKEIQDIMIKLPESSAVKARVMRILRPSSKLGRATLYIGGLSVLFIALGWITGPRSGSKLSGWATFVTVVFAFCAMLLTLRWAGRIIRPSSKLGRATLWVGGLSVLFIALGWIAGPAPGSKLSGWATFVTVVFAFCALLLAVRWARQILRPSTKLGRATLVAGRIERPLLRSALDHRSCVGIEAEWLGDVRYCCFRILCLVAYLPLGPGGISCGGYAID